MNTHLAQTPVKPNGVVLPKTLDTLTQEEARFWTLAERSTQMIFIRAGGCMVYANPACISMVGYTQEELCRHQFDLLTLMAQGSSPAALRRYETEITEPHEEPFEISLLTRHGAIIDAILARTMIEYNGSRAILGILTDITTRKRAERIQQQQQNRMHQLTVKLAATQDEEQRRIAQGLHDDVAQVLAACSLQLAELQRISASEPIDQITRSIDKLLLQAQKTIRSLTFELASSTLYRLGLQAALEELCETKTTRYNIRFKMTVVGTIPPIETSTATILFKATRELLYNIVKHAGVTEALLQIVVEESHLTVSVKDRGRGFPASANSIQNGTGLGLFSIEERLRDLGGSVVIDSTPGVLTQVSLRVPFKTDMHP